MNIETKKGNHSYRIELVILENDRDQIILVLRKDML